MSELSMFDYINGITIGSIAAEMATSLDGKFYYPLLSIVVYTVVIWSISLLSQKNVKCRRFFTGRSIILMRNGKIYKKNFKTAKIDINDFLTQCRINGYFKLDDINTAILEQNGKISFLPRVDSRPVNTKDLNLQLNEDKIANVLIIDGMIMDKNLKESGNNETWLQNELKKQKIGSVTDVFFAEYDGNQLYVYKKIEDEPKNDPFQ
jgi:uncharacterized membrane protein YcaP (DUF421 family)